MNDCASKFSLCLRWEIVLWLTLVGKKRVWIFPPNRSSSGWIWALSKIKIALWNQLSFSKKIVLPSEYSYLCNHFCNKQIIWFVYFLKEIHIYYFFKVIIRSLSLGSNDLFEYAIYMIYFNRPVVGVTTSYHLCYDLKFFVHFCSENYKIIENSSSIGPK